MSFIEFFLYSWQNSADSHVTDFWYLAWNTVKKFSKLDFFLNLIFLERLFLEGFIIYSNYSFAILKYIFQSTKYVRMKFLSCKGLPLEGAELLVQKIAIFKLRMRGYYDT